MLQENTFQKEFHDACESGDIEVVQLLLDRGTDINQADIRGQTPLYIACAHGHREVTELLLDRGAQINQANSYGETPLYVACNNGHIKVADLLIDREANIDQAIQGGYTPLWITCESGDIETVELLLARRAQINQPNDFGETPLYTACLHGHRAVVELLLARGANINQARDSGLTPLLIACSCGRREVAKLLLDRGADINQAKNKLDDYIPEQLEAIIGSCADQRHAGRANAMYFYIIAYRCYKQLQLVDSSYTPNDRERLVIDHGQVQQERQAHMLLSLFFDQNKKQEHLAISKYTWRKVTTFLPLSWLRNDDNTTTHQSSVS